MTLPEDLIEHINKNSAKKYVTKTDIEFIKANIKQIEGKLTKKDNNKIKNLVSILSKNKILSIDRKELNTLRPLVINIIQKHAEEFNDDPNEDILDDKLSITEIEKNVLDKKVPKYNKYDEKHPMIGITFNDNKQKYQIKYDDIDTYTKKLETAVTKIKEKMALKNTDNFLENSVKKTFTYKDHYFISYWHKNEPYFDIQHIISLLNLNISYIKEKYNEFANQIVYCLWHKNEFGGYILRELITTKCMHKIVMSSNSKLSKSFKDDIADILEDLRKKDKLYITNEKLGTKKSGKKKYKNVDTEKQIYLENIPTAYSAYRYNNPNNVLYANTLILCGKHIAFTKYLNKHVLYAFLMPLKTDNPCIIIKFGYTENIQQRVEDTLPKEYGCPVFLIGLKVIKGRSDEKIFHDALKLRYPELHMGTEINRVDKIELYGLHPILIKEFNNFLTDNFDNEIIEESTKLTKEEQDTIDIIKNQDHGGRYKNVNMIQRPLIKHDITNDDELNEGMRNDQIIIQQIELENKKLEVTKEERRLESDKIKRLELELKLSLLNKSIPKTISRRQNNVVKL